MLVEGAGLTVHACMRQNKPARATDERNFVKKAVNWALRNIGKRNLNLNKAAIKTAKEIWRIDSKVARWVSSDAIKELESEAVQRRVRK